MATIQMTGGTFTVCPEGRHIFRIYKVDFNPDFGKVVVYMVNAQGITHRENFGLMRADGSMNEGPVIDKNAIMESLSDVSATVARLSLEQLEAWLAQIAYLTNDCTVTDELCRIADLRGVVFGLMDGLKERLNDSLAISLLEILLHVFMIPGSVKDLVDKQKLPLLTATLQTIAAALKTKRRRNPKVAVAFFKVLAELNETRSIIVWYYRDEGFIRLARDMIEPSYDPDIIVAPPQPNSR